MCHVTSFLMFWHLWCKLHISKVIIIFLPFDKNCSETWICQKWRICQSSDSVIGLLNNSLIWMKTQKIRIWCLMRWSQLIVMKSTGVPDSSWQMKRKVIHKNPFMSCGRKWFVYCFVRRLLLVMMMEITV